MREDIDAGSCIKYYQTVGFKPFCIAGETALARGSVHHHCAAHRDEIDRAAACLVDVVRKPRKETKGVRHDDYAIAGTGGAVRGVFRGIC